MTALTLPMPGLMDLRATPTPTASREGNKRLERWVRLVNDASGLHWQDDVDATPLEDELSTTLSRATAAVFHQARYLGTECATAIAASLADLLSVESWDEDDQIPTIGSVRALIRAIVALDRGCGDLTLARTGNLVSTWRMGDDVLRLEAKATGRYAWTILHAKGATPRHEHISDGDIRNLKTALAAL